jgi:hypothetical protein
VSAVRKVAEGEDCSRNVVVFGMPEEDEENVDLKLSYYSTNWVRSSHNRRPHDWSEKAWGA